MTGTMRWGKLILLCVLALIVYFVLRGAMDRHVVEAAEEETVLRVQLSEMRDENTTLLSDIEGVGSDSYIESRAR